LFASAFPADAAAAAFAASTFAAGCVDVELKEEKSRVRQLKSSNAALKETVGQLAETVVGKQQLLQVRVP